jgi:hypothetical protein
LLRDRGPRAEAAPSSRRDSFVPFNVSDDHIGIDEYDVLNQG